MRKVLLLLALFALICQTRGEDWSQFHGPFRNGKTSINAPVNMFLWWRPVPPLSVLSGPATRGDSVFLPTTDSLICVSTDGNPIWSVAGSFENVPALLESLLVVTSNVSLRAFTYDGSSIGSITVSNQIWTPVVLRETIFITEGISVWKITSGGDTVWHRECSPGFVNAAPAVDDSGRVFVATLADPLGWYDYRIYGFNQNGDQIFFHQGSRFPFVESEGNQVTPTITPTGIVLATYPDPGHVWFHGCYLVRFAGGSTRWEGTMYHASAACDVQRNRIYHVDGDTIVARDLAGNFIWRSADLGTISYSSPAVDGEGNIFVGTDLGVFYVLNPDGTIRFRHDTGNGILTSPAIAADGRVVIASTAGRLYCFGYVVAVEEQPMHQVSGLRDGYYDITGRQLQAPPRRGICFRVERGGRTTKVVRLR